MDVWCALLLKFCKLPKDNPARLMVTNVQPMMTVMLRLELFAVTFIMSKETPLTVDTRWKCTVTWRMTSYLR